MADVSTSSRRKQASIIMDKLLQSRIRGKVENLRSVSGIRPGKLRCSAANFGHLLVTDLAFSELPFLNQPIAKSSRRQPLEPPDSNAYRKQKVTPYDMRASVGEMRKEASSVCEETGSEQHFSRIMQDRPRSPKRINIESSTSPTKPKRTAPSSKKKSDFNVPPEQKDSHQASHRPQGLSLETRDLSSAASNRLSVQGTLQATTPASRVLSSLPGSGQQLSSLTGLSAGSLARRRLLRRMDRAAESLEPRPTRDELQRELHAFRALESQDQQGHGPSARYGSAKIPIKTPRPPPDLPQPGPSYFPSVLPDLCRSCSSAKMQHIHRSPDWFASNGSNADVAHNNAQIFSRDTASVKTPMYAGPGFDQYAQSANVIPDYGLPTGSSDYYSAFQNNRHVDVGLPDHAPQASTSYGHSVQAPAHQQAFDEQFAQHGCTLNENFPSTEYSWELVGRRPLQRSSPQMMSSAGHAHLQTCIPNASPVVPGSFPSSVPYMDEVAQFQRGREDLFSYFPHTSSPARLQPLSGFWQRNYL